MDNWVDNWRKLGPFDIDKALKYLNETIDEDYPLQSISHEFSFLNKDSKKYQKGTYKWNGQSYIQTANGWGRNVGQFGIFEGLYVDGAPFYGRLVSNQNYYVGYLNSAGLNGRGTFYKRDATKYSFSNLTAIWEGGCCIKSAIDTENPLYLAGQKWTSWTPPIVNIQVTLTIHALSTRMTQTPSLDSLIPISAEKQQTFNKMQYIWLNSKPLDISSLQNSGKLKVNESLKVTTIHNQEFTYNGQTTNVVTSSRRRLKGHGVGGGSSFNPQITQLVSDGIGQQYGIWGIYEGEFDKGSISGYGRMIMPNQNVYVGYFTNGSFGGNGVLTLKDGTAKTGTWMNNELIKTQNGNNVSYIAIVIVVPKVLRTIPQNELNLIGMFNQVPQGASNDTLNLWKLAGPFDLQSYTNNGSLTFEEDLRLIGMGTNVQTFGEAQFSGQVKAYSNLLFFNETTNQDYMVNNTNLFQQPFGVGRIIMSDYIFEGLIDVESNSNPNQVKIFRIITKNNVTTYFGKNITLSQYQPVEKFVKGALIYDGLESTLSQINSLYNQVTWIPKGFNLTSYINNKNWFICYLNKGMMNSFNTNLQFKKFNQHDYAQYNVQTNMIQGFGRLVKINVYAFLSVYDGEILDGKYHGYGRLITQTPYSIKQGYWQNDVLVAQNKTVWDLQQMFEEPYSPSINYVKQNSFDFAGLLASGKIQMRDNNLLTNGWPLEITSISVKNSTANSKSTYRGILAQNGKIFQGIYRKQTSFIGKNEQIVREGSLDYYRTINSKGTIKWLKGTTVISEMTQSTMCNGMLQPLNVTNNQINFEYVASNKPININTNASSFFKNLDPERCSIKKCHLMQNGMLYKGGIQINYNFSISAISNLPEGNTDTLMIVCVTSQDQSSYVEAVFNQSKCNGSKCLQSNVTTQIKNGTCSGTLLKNSQSNTTIVMLYTLNNQMNQINRTALEFFNSTNSTSCPITNCSLKQPDCKQDYLDGIIVSNTTPFGFQAITNFKEGWIDPVCLLCQNKDEVQSVIVQFDQLSCNQTGNCPVAKQGQCRGTLDHIDNPRPVIMPFTPNNIAHYSRINADSFFVNRDDLYCPITKCQVKQPDCKTNYTDGIYIDENAPFGIFAHTDFIDGWIDPLCLICENQDEIVAIEIEVDQLSCTQSRNCPLPFNDTGNSTRNITQGACAGHLDHVPNPRTVVMSFNPTSQMQYSGVNALQYFANDDPQNCPITNCTIKAQDCINNYTEGIFVDDKDPFGIFAITDFPNGWIDPVCLICENQDEQVAIEININQISCGQSGNCPRTQNIGGNSTIGQCIGHLDHIDNPKPVIFPYSSSDQLQSLPPANISAAGYFQVDDPQNCPISQCQLKQTDCKTDYPHGVFVNQLAPFDFSAYTNYTDGWIDPLCLICSNKDETVTLQIEVDQLSCAQTGNCPKQPADSCIGDMIEDLGHLTNPKPIIVPFNPSGAPQYSRWNAEMIIVSKQPQRCPILNCTIRQPDCKSPYDEGITVDSKAPFGIFVEANFPDGWIDPVCLVCQNKDEQFSVQAEVDQLSCNQTDPKLCPKQANETMILNPSGSCVDHLSIAPSNNVETLSNYNPQKIEANFTRFPGFGQVRGIKASSYFKSDDLSNCPITNCTIKQVDCVSPISSILRIKSFVGQQSFSIEGIMNFPDGWIAPVCLQCQNKDEVRSVQIQITQLSCSNKYNSTKCPKTVNVTRPALDMLYKDACKGHLIGVQSPKKIILPFINNQQNMPTQTQVISSQFFVNDDPSRCPVIGCNLMQPGCKTNATQSGNVTISTFSPFELWAQQSYKDGFTQQYCLMCSNYDESISVNIEVEQVNCETSNNCQQQSSFQVPNNHTLGACKGHLSPQLSQVKNIRLPYKPLTQQQYTNFDAMQFFFNDDPEQCPITSCAIMTEGCVQNYTEVISVEIYSPFRISALTDYPNGWVDPVCVRCANYDGFEQYNLNITQAPCSETRNCPSDNQPKPTAPVVPPPQPLTCAKALNPISNPQKIILPFSPSENQMYSRVNAQDFFINSNPENCPIRGCMLMLPGCKKNYTDEVSVDQNAPFGIFAQQNYPDGWIDPVCLLCSNQDANFTINIEIDQLSCVETENCPSGNGTATVAPIAQPGECKGHLQAIKNSNQIRIPFDSSMIKQYTRANALQFYTNDDPQACPIVECRLMNANCTQNYTNDNRISVDLNFPYGVFAQQNFFNGYSESLCLVCSNQDESVQYQNFEVQQIACDNKTCPTVSPNATNNPPGSCYGTLSKNNNFDDLMMDYVDNNLTRYVNKNATQFFSIKEGNEDQCPITRCDLNQADCRTPYEDGIGIEQNAPYFSINAQTGFPYGWLDPLCITCSNKDQTVAHSKTFGQYSCVKTRDRGNSKLKCPA